MISDMFDMEEPTLIEELVYWYALLRLSSTMESDASLSEREALVNRIKTNAEELAEEVMIQLEHSVDKFFSVLKEISHQEEEE